MQLSFPAYAFNTDDKTAAVSVLMAQIDPANAGRYNSDSQVRYDRRDQQRPQVKFVSSPQPDPFRLW